MARRKVALRGFHEADDFAVPAHREGGGEFGIIRPGAVEGAVERDVVIANRDFVARLERHDALRTPLGFAHNAEQRDAKAEMRERGAPGGPRQTGGASQHRRQRRAQQPDAFADIGDGAGDDEQRQANAERRQQGLALQHEGCREANQRDQESAREALCDTDEIATLPCQQRPERNCDQQAREQRPEGRSEEWRADRNFLSGQSLQPKRVERSDEHGGTGRGEEQVVEDERSFARHRRKQPALAQQRGAPCEQQEAPANEPDEDRQDEDASRRIGCKGVHRGEHAGTHQEGADQR